MGWHEIDYLTRVLITDRKNNYNSASIVDIHEIWGNLQGITKNMAIVKGAATNAD